MSSERQEFSALKSTTTLLESELASLDEEMQRKKDEREVERLMEKKKHKELEREKQLEKDARVRKLRPVYVKSMERFYQRSILFLFSFAYY